MDTREHDIECQWKVVICHFLVEVTKRCETYVYYCVRVKPYEPPNPIMQLLGVHCHTLKITEENRRETVECTHPIPLVRDEWVAVSPAAQRHALILNGRCGIRSMYDHRRI